MNKNYSFQFISIVVNFQLNTVQVYGKYFKGKQTIRRCGVLYTTDRNIAVRALQKTYYSEKLCVCVCRTKSCSLKYI